MANNLTGDFDLVAQFSVPAVNRVLAAMHRMERFPHSMSLRVDDTPPRGPRTDRPTIVGSVDIYGDPTTDHRHIAVGDLNDILPTGTSPEFSNLDGIVNVDVGSLELPPLVPSHLKGKAQLQVFPPSIDITDASGKNLTVRMQLMSRYFPDPNTDPLAEFIRGDLRITAAVNQVVTEKMGSVVEIDVKANSVIIDFTPLWSSHPLSAPSLAGISQVIRNALRTSFLPSNTRLPSNVKHMQFRTMHGARKAVAVLIDTGDAAGNPASASNVFLSGADEFAFAAGAEFVRAAFQPTIDSMLANGVDPFTVKKTIWGQTVDATYTVTLTSVTVKLENGKIVFEVKGGATTGAWWAPNFNFTVKQPFTLVADGATANLVPGDISLETDSWIVNLFKGGAKGQMRKMRDDALEESDAFNVVRQKLSAEESLSGFLNSLLTPPRPQPVVEPDAFSLAYSSVEIRPDGIILHGTLSVTNWPGLQIEFEKIPASGGSAIPGDLISHGPDYTALKTWIPGGTIDRYEWGTLGQPQSFLVEQNKFVYIHPPPEFSDGGPSTRPVSAFRPFCVTVWGTRLSSSGPVVEQTVAGSMCLFTRFPILDGFTADPGGPPLMVALAQPGPLGMVEVTGHSAAPATGTGIPNLLVHFADEKSAGQLELLTRALRESGREDATTGVLVVLSADQLATAPYTPGITYADDRDGSWARALGVKDYKVPLTLIRGRKKKIVWKHEGELDSSAIAGALREYLVAGGRVKLELASSSVRTRRLPPNFLFEYAPGRQLTLRKLTGRPVRLVFWRSSSKPSIEAVREAQTANDGNGKQEPVVLAINDGDDRELAQRIAAENKLSATIVTDPDRKIAAAYNVDMWPTVVSIDALGLVRSIRYGRGDGESAGAPQRQSAEQGK